MKNLEKIIKAEKTLNSALLKIIIGFSFLADSKDEIRLFLKKHTIQIANHLLNEFLKFRKYYESFKTRHKEYKG